MFISFYFGASFIKKKQKRRFRCGISLQAERRRFRDTKVGRISIQFITVSSR